MEEAWEYAWQTRVYTDNLFGKGFTELYDNRTADAPPLPALFLNGTSVETGGRIITSNLKFEGNIPDGFIAAIDGVDKMAGAELRLSTAVHDSARFTYISPAGRFPDGTHVVDGGYFENSGAGTARDLLNAVQRKRWTNVTPVLIIIKNDPLKIGQPDISKPLFPRATSELLAPVITLFNTRSAHADLALGELQAAPATSIVFSLIDRGIPLPLGWTLSGEAMAEMDFQVDPQGVLPDQQKKWTACSPTVRVALKNSACRSNVLAYLAPQPVATPSGTAPIRGDGQK